MLCPSTLWCTAQACVALHSVVCRAGQLGRGHQPAQPAGAAAAGGGGLGRAGGRAGGRWTRMMHRERHEQSCAHVSVVASRPVACSCSHVHTHQQRHPFPSMQADIMFSLRHPNCVQLMGTVTSPPCLVTEYCGRGSLTDCLRVRETPLPCWLCDTASGLPALSRVGTACLSRGREARSIPASSGRLLRCSRRPPSATPAKRRR